MHTQEDFEPPTDARASTAAHPPLRRARREIAPSASVSRRPGGVESVPAAPRRRLVPASATAVDLIRTNRCERSSADSALLFPVERVSRRRPRGCGEESSDVGGERHGDHEEGCRSRTGAYGERDDERDDASERPGQAAGDGDPLAQRLGELPIVMGARCGQPSTWPVPNLPQSPTSVPPDAPGFNQPRAAPVQLVLFARPRGEASPRPILRKNDGRPRLVTATSAIPSK